MDASRDVTGGRLLARNTVLNLLAQGLPLLVALVAFPLIIAGLGTERFGILALVWVLVGYFGFLDLGLGRSLTQVVSRRLARGEEDGIAVTVWTALTMIAGLGVLGGAFLYWITPVLVRDVFNISGTLQRESVAAFRLLAVTLPLITSTAGLRGFLESFQRFGVLSAIRIPMATFSLLAPLVVLPFTRDLGVIVAVLVAGRVVGWGLHLYFSIRSYPELADAVGFRTSELKTLLRLGGWMTVSNVVSPLMTYFDRFLIGALLTMSAVAYYTTPYEVVTKLWIVPGAVVGVFFPAFAGTFAADPDRTGRLFDGALRAILVVLFPVTLGVVAFAPEALAAWVGDEFARNGTVVARWLAVGVFVNSLAQVPFTLIQGVGRPDVTARIHLIELPVYAGLLVVLTMQLGIVGAAMAWTLRAGVDAVVLFALSGRYVPEIRPSVARFAWWGASALMLLGVVGLQTSAMARLAVFGAVLAGFLVFSWWRILPAGDRASLLEWVAVAR